jgi:riboflavin synthase
MFTGIIQTMGIVRSIQPQGAVVRLVLDAPDLTRPIVHGSSVCVSGVCLTAVAHDAVRVEFDVVPETLSRSKLGRLRIGQRVNLEPSLRVGDPMDGHIVQGHVDGLAEVIEIRRDGDGVVGWFRVEVALLDTIVPKGSIAIDGVSLTLAEVRADRFSVAWIPTTLELTTLSELRTGDRVNIETDIVARTILHQLRRIEPGLSGERSGLTVELLREKGWR